MKNICKCAKTRYSKCDTNNIQGVFLWESLPKKQETFERTVTVTLNH